jgi:TRAP-type mannitol/chloroaromatic compound transport system substrate-binding protein
MKRREFLTTASVASAAIVAPQWASAQTSLQWKMVTTWPKNFPGLGTGAESLARKIESLSGGRLKVRVFGAGELVPPMGVFDAVSRGTVEMGHGAAYYWKGKHEASQFFAAIPFGMNAVEMNAWLKFGGGQKLWEELYASFGLVGFAAGNTGVQMGGWFNKEIKSPADFKGLKMRMPGLGGDVLRSLGCTVVNLAGGEIFQALQTGSIDATEWVGPYNDLAFGLQQISKFYYFPGWHEPGTTIEAMINKKAFDALSKDLQAIVREACAAAHDEMLAEMTLRNASALETLIQKHKVQLRRFSDETLKQLEGKSQEVVRAIAAKDSFTKKVFDSFLNARRQSMLWSKNGEEAFAASRTEWKI